jgi:hypothetical protein
MLPSHAKKNAVLPLSLGELMALRSLNLDIYSLLTNFSISQSSVLLGGGDTMTSYDWDF